MTKIASRKLHLNRETLLPLQNDELVFVLGGENNQGAITFHNSVCSASVTMQGPQCTISVTDTKSVSVSNLPVCTNR
jgi:hypothetical protein